MDLHASNIYGITRRECEDLVNLFSDLGGIFAFLTGIGIAISFYFGKTYTKAIFANKGYKNPVDHKYFKIKT